MTQFFQIRDIPVITSDMSRIKEGLKEILKIDDERIEKKNKLYVASLKGQKQNVKSLLIQGVGVNHTDGRDEHTPLHAASCKGHASVMQLLLEGGADVNKANKMGWTALHFAVGTIKEETMKISRLQQSGNNHSPADTYPTVHNDDFEKRIEPLQVLLKHGGNVNLQNNVGNTPLHDAVCLYHIEAVKLLLQHGAEVNIKNKEGFTPLHDARHPDKKAILQLLLSYQTQDKEGNTWLHQALQGHDLKYAAFLIRCGMSLHVKNNQGHSPLRILSNQLPKYFAQQPAEGGGEEKHDLAGLSCK